MIKKGALILLTLISATLVLAGCAAGDGSAQASSPSSAAESTGLVLTLEELAKYDGQNGNPAYIAVDGVVYDVSNVPQWKDGKHNGFTAGNDLTDAIRTKSPHGVSKLKNVPAVGTLANA